VSTLRAPAPRACSTCPYRRDVPAGVWAASEYVKLAGYDGDTSCQPVGVFQCHQGGRGRPGARVCAGWAAVHGRQEGGRALLALRLGVVFGTLSARVVEAILSYRTTVPLFTSGAEAAEHGMARIGDPGADARQAMGKIMRRRGDLR
jgi:hypothetical protein